MHSNIQDFNIQNSMNPYCVRLDDIFERYVKKYKAGKISQDTYFSMCVDALKEAWSPWDLNL